MAEYIKREAAIAICEEEYREQLRILNYAGDSVAWNIGHAIKVLPTEDVAPVVYGRWMPFHSEAAGDIQYCSACEIGFDAKMAYCPNCGIKMDMKYGGDNDAVD